MGKSPDPDLEIACPKCEVPPGSRCETRRGKIVYYIHAARRRYAAYLRLDKIPARRIVRRHGSEVPLFR